MSKAIRFHHTGGRRYWCGKRSRWANPALARHAHRQFGIAQNYRFDGAHGPTIRGGVRVPRKLRMRRTGPEEAKSAR